MTPLAAGAVENARPDGKSENLDEPSDVLPIADWIEQRLVFNEVMLVEILFPPV
jgi:hypothetical protein